MRVTFVVVGWENIAVEYISASLKQRGHEVHLAYEQALFNDRNYLCVPWLANALDQKGNLIKQIVDSRPDMVCFSVFAITYQWALERAREVKQYLDVPIVFGGVHAITCPERIVIRPEVDAVCLGEGEFALADLLDSMADGRMDTTMDGFWFRGPDGEPIMNPRRDLIADLDVLPFPDKELFAPVIPMHHFNLTSTNRGCPFSCTYCSTSYLTKVEKELGNFKKVRERSVDNVIEEMKLTKRRYGYKWIDIRNAVLSPSPKWTIEFCEKYKREIDLPFRIFSHPLLIREDTSEALREAGCFAIQLGLESYDPKVRNEILNRPESNADINNAVVIMERARLNYSLDYILGLPGQEEAELKEAGELFSRLKYCYRISPFMLAYLPKLEILETAISQGMVHESERERVEEGLHGNYMDKGSPMQVESKRFFEKYKLLFRSMTFLPRWARKLFLRSKLYYVFDYLPFGFILRFLDAIMVVRDRDARAYALNYWWWFTRRLDRTHPNYWRSKMS